MENQNENLTPLCITENEVHETIIQDALTEAGITYHTRSYHDSAFDGFYENKMGHSQILVFEHELEQAQEIIKTINPPENKDR